MAGIDNPESVAAHSFGTSFIALILSELLKDAGKNINLEKVLIMTILHDISESLTSDIPRVVSNMGGYEFKREKQLIEQQAMDSLLGKFQELENILRVWQELQAGDSLEAKVVHDADIFDMLIHAIHLKQQGVSVQILQQFFNDQEIRVFPELFKSIQALLDNE